MKRRYVFYFDLVESMILGLIDQIASLDQVRAEKKEKKHFEKQKKAMGLGGGTSMIKPKEPAKPVGTIPNLFI